jgi:hypothetical protein
MAMTYSDNWVSGKSIGYLFNQVVWFWYFCQFRQLIYVLIPVCHMTADVENIPHVSLLKLSIWKNSTPSQLYLFSKSDTNPENHCDH